MYILRRLSKEKNSKQILSFVACIYKQLGNSKRKKGGLILIPLNPKDTEIITVLFTTAVPDSSKETTNFNDDKVKSRCVDYVRDLVFKYYCILELEAQRLIKIWVLNK